MATETKAGHALRFALSPNNPKRVMTQSDLARRLGCAQPSLSQWVRMNTRPEPHYRTALERELGIPVDDWLTEDERAIADGTQVPPAAKSRPRLADATADETGERAAVVVPEKAG